MSEGNALVYRRPTQVVCQRREAGRRRHGTGCQLRTCRAAAGANVANAGRAAASSNLSDEAGGENRANGGRLLARRVSLVSDGDGGSIKIERMNCG